MIFIVCFITYHLVIKINHLVIIYNTLHSSKCTRNKK
uniref:Uncharacterized protein n=1 Tax=Amphimedon queenslandica TaxID=400682 RepID=A0A1X7TBY1_AMPQE